MQKNLDKFEQAARIVAGSILLFLSFTVFSHPVAKLLVILAGIWILLEGVLARCPLYHELGIKKPGAVKRETMLMLMVAGMQAAVGYAWWHAGWVQIWSGDFAASLPAFFARCAAVSHWLFMRNFLLNQATRYHLLYGGLIELLQYAIGIGLVVLAYVWVSARSEETQRATLYLSAVGLGVGVIMNAVFFFAVGPINTWIATGNAVMFWIQLIMFYGYVNLLMTKER